MRVGWKQTEVGIIPEDWDCVALGSIGDFTKGKGISRADSSSGAIPCVRYGELYTHHTEIIRSFNSYISQEVAKSSKRLRKGDLLFAGSGETKEDIGKCAAFIGDEEAYAGGDVIIFSPYDACSAFLGYLLNFPVVVRQKASKGQGDAIVHVSTASLSAILIPLPPTVMEQRAIAEALSDVDALIDSLDKLIAKKRDIKQGAMQELLTGKKRLPGFSGEWVRNLLGDLAEIISGATPRTTEPAFWDGPINWCTPTDITSCKGKYLVETERTISELGLASCNTSVLPVGSLLLCSRATIGEIRIAGCEVCTNQGFRSLICKEGVSNEFLYYRLSMMKPQMVERAIGSTFLEISKKDTAGLEILIPEYAEQAAIAEVLSDMDAEILALEQRRDKTVALKQGMMQELLTGRTRLV